MTTTGEKIRVQRVIKGYSQEWMSYKLKISQAAYSNLERGGTKLSLDRVFEIAEILEISPFILMPKPKFSIGINYGNFWQMIINLKETLLSKLRGAGKLSGEV